MLRIVGPGYRYPRGLEGAAQTIGVLYELPVEVAIWVGIAPVAGALQGELAPLYARSLADGASADPDEPEDHFWASQLELDYLDDDTDLDTLLARLRGAFTPT